MADWLDSADKVASVVGALAGLAALVITVRDRNRRAASAAAPPLAEPRPDVEHVPSWEPPVVEPAPPAGPAPAAGPPRAKRPTQRPKGSSGVGDVVFVLVYYGGIVLLGAWLLSWVGGGSIGPWWLLAGLTVSRMISLFFHGPDVLRSGGEILLYILWISVSAWLSARGFVYYWFPDLFGNQGIAFIVIIAVVVVIGAIVGFVKASS